MYLSLYFVLLEVVFLYEHIFNEKSCVTPFVFNINKIGESCQTTKYGTNVTNYPRLLTAPYINRMTVFPQGFSMYLLLG